MRGNKGVGKVQIKGLNIKLLMGSKIGMKGFTREGWKGLFNKKLPDDPDDRRGKMDLNRKS